MRGRIEDLGKVSVTVEEEDYRIDKAYYHNTIVVDPELGISCISIRPVPAGIPLTDTRFWKCLNRLETSVMINYRRMSREVKELKTIVESFLKSSGKGIALSNELGSSDTFGMTQRAIRDNIFELRKRVSDLERTNCSDFNIKVSPDFILDGDETPVTVYVDDGCECEIFDWIKIYINEELKFSKDNVADFEYKTTIVGTTKIEVEGMRDGVYSFEKKIIKPYYPFIIGCGKELEDIFIKDNLRRYNEKIDGSYPVDCKNNDYIFILIEKEGDSQIDTIKLNDDTIEMTKTEYDNYFVYKSLEVYEAGKYNVNINV